MDLWVQHSSISRYTGVKYAHQTMRLLEDKIEMDG